MVNGKIALVTGATSGIGLAIAQRLAAEGADIVMHGRSADPLAMRDLCRGLSAREGITCAYIAADLSIPEEADRLAREAATALGPIDILVNNAGMQHVAPLEAFPPEKWDQIISLNLSAAFHLTRVVFAGMKARQWGRIINIASAHSLVASPYKSAYVASKHGLLGLTKVAALEGAEAGVTVNAICPGYVLTPLVQKQIPDTAKARGITEAQVVRDVLLAAQPTKKFATVEEVAALTAFLCTPGAQSITGAALPVDGGWTAH
ncbi:MAG TPA: 3-hydroxybutyrate dehydrogenase [Alphaproteobacteria bacterium]|nr:3-hydroxybutyrate dehydrogenase [Alphaproteobacteria bacterium]HAJ46115.1 3-hydroxybutyrate dehydrogenase [Alphaproteobacteria bacterium]